MSDIRSETARLVERFGEFGLDLAKWILEHRAVAMQGSLTRESIMPAVLEIERLGEALRTRPSVGLYGESQCGKSMLLSRFASSLGAAEGSDGGLLIVDPTPDEHLARSDRRPEWADDSDRQGTPEASERRGIDFRRWIDPAEGKESTGLVTRLVTAGPTAKADGMFRLDLASVGDLLAMLAVGFDATRKPIDDLRRRERIRAELQRLRDLHAEPGQRHMDRDHHLIGIMSRLLEAWALISDGPLALKDRQRIASLRAAGCEWELFVRRCIDDGVAPRDSATSDDEPSDLDRLVGLLWDGDPHVTKIWRHLHKRLRELRYARSVLVPATSVCKSKRQVVRKSLLSIQLLAEDLQTEILRGDGTVSIVRVPQADGRGRDVSVPRATLAALGTVLSLEVLPKPQASAEGVVIDVLDYPGARPHDLGAQTDRYDNLGEALKGLVRGKVAFLFNAGVMRHDCTALCLTVSGEGNLESGGGIRRSIEEWLRREGRVMTDSPNEVDPTVDPPLVVAVTKSDLVLGHALDPREHRREAFRSVIEKIERAYVTREHGSRSDWWNHWHGQQASFDRVYWTHNPVVVGAGHLRGLKEKESEPDGFRRQIESCFVDVVARHTKIERIEAVLNPPADVEGLFDDLQQLAAPAATRRLESLLRKAIRELGVLTSSARRVYRGAGDPERNDRLREEARRHVAGLERLVRDQRPDLLARLLHLVSMPPEAVAAAFRDAAEVAASAADDVYGILRFPAFYERLKETFLRRFDMEKCSQREIWSVVSRSVQDQDQDGDRWIQSLDGYFKQMPNLEWFGKMIERAAGPLIDDYDTSATPVEALSEIVSAAWNRCIVWLPGGGTGESAGVPAGKMFPANLPPKLRNRSAASERILEHWRQRLPEVYVEIIDARGAGTDENKRLEKMQQKLDAAVNQWREMVEIASGRGGTLVDPHRELLPSLAQLADELPRHIDLLDSAAVGRPTPAPGGSR